MCDWLGREYGNGKPKDMKNKAESNASAKQKGRKKNKVQFFIL